MAVFARSCRIDIQAACTALDPYGGKKASWAVLLDTSSGAVLHVERLASDVLNAIPVEKPTRVPADRRPVDRPIGSVNWVDHLKMTAGSAIIRIGGENKRK